ncbi:MAG: right-handed parallel beta-helix repeat-containing protein, partial [Candidatus Bathyarchaeota archaeon]|nr:right-handed parallel beta-helix repeat-containing protein [Candidatus Bathyarchaeota archaeon]
TNNLAGVQLSTFSNYNTVSGNNITNNHAGVTLSLLCNYSTISANTITANGYGVQLTYGSSNNTISGNTITSNECGVNLFSYSNSNIISANTMANNSCGIRIEASGYNEFYHNYLDNVNQTYVESGYANTWDNGYPTGGNYWSDYADKYPNATEIDELGLWDTPYVIDENNQDNYPIIPEISSLLVLPLFMTGSLLATLAYRRRRA